LKEQLAAQVKHGDHLCVICESPRQRLEAAAQYVADGLRRNELVMYAADRRTTSVLRRMLEQLDIDVQSQIARGALHLPSAEDAYLHDGDFDPDRMYETFERTIEGALAAGFSGCRFAGEPTWALEHEALRPGLIDFESRLNQLFRGRKAAGLCVYDRQAWPASVLRDVLRTHPVAVAGDLVCPSNLYYERPDLLDREAGAASQVTWMLAQLREVRRHDVRLQMALEAGRLGSWELDRVTGTSVCSPGHDRIFGYAHPPTGWTVDRFVEHVLPEDRERVSATLRGAIERGDAWHLECRIVRRGDGAVRWIEAHGQPETELTEHGATVRRLMGIVADITERKAHEQRLREADHRKDEFLAMLAHELRNPLAPLTYAHRLLAHSDALGAPERSALAMAERQTRQLTRLVDDLLEVGRITRGRIELRCEPMTVGAAVRAAVESVLPACEQRRQKVTCAVPEAPVRIVADPTRVAQVLENLLNNASKYTADGGTVDVEVERRWNEVEIRVTDSGIGIEPGKIPLLFELFSQIDPSLDRSQGGLGIGLALVKRLVELHGGRVAARSDGLGTGSTFVVILPCDAP
jgi:PAS domain S-box-containing protein